MMSEQQTIFTEAFQEISITNWTLEQLQKMVAEFNALHPEEDVRRGEILENLHRAHILRFVFYNCGDFVIVPERLIHWDLCAEQFNDAANENVVTSFFSFNLAGKVSDKELEEADKEALLKAEASGQLKKYVRKYPDNPKLKCKVEKCEQEKYHFTIIGRCLSLSPTKRKMPIQVSKISRISLLELGHLPDFEDYVDLQIII